MQILFVEDNEFIAKGLKYSLEQKGFIVFHASSIKQANTILHQEKIHFIILDISLPDGDGFELYEKKIKAKRIPTIFLTAKDDEDDVVKGLELGADDYITKPFSTRELMARINKIFMKNKENTIIQVKDITFDMDKMVVCRREEKIEFTSLELKILHLLFLNLNKVVSRNDMIEKVWEWTGNDINDNTITVYLKRIREKLKTDIIVTIKGIGYRIDQ